jgi:hypothetical protein
VCEFLDVILLNLKADRDGPGMCPSYRKVGRIDSASLGSAKRINTRR